MGPPFPSARWFSGTGGAVGVKIRIELKFDDADPGSPLHVFVWSNATPSFDVPDCTFSIDDGSGKINFGPNLMKGMSGTVVTGIDGVWDAAKQEVRLAVHIKVSRWVPTVTIKSTLVCVDEPFGGVDATSHASSPTIPAAASAAAAAPGDASSAQNTETDAAGTTKSGWLEKKPRKARTTGRTFINHARTAFLSHWHRRFFVVTCDAARSQLVVKYYKNDCQSQLCGSFTLDPTSQVEVEGKESKGKGGFAFVLGRETIHVAAKTETEREAWVAFVANKLDLLRQSFDQQCKMVKVVEAAGTSSSTGAGSGSGSGGVAQNASFLRTLSKKMELMVGVRDNFSHFQRHADTFRGAEAVQFLLSSSLAIGGDEAAAIARLEGMLHLGFIIAVEVATPAGVFDGSEAALYRFPAEQPGVDQLIAQSAELEAQLHSMAVELHEVQSRSAEALKALRQFQLLTAKRQGELAVLAGALAAVAVLAGPVLSLLFSSADSGRGGVLQLALAVVLAAALPLTAHVGWKRWTRADAAGVVASAAGGAVSASPGREQSPKEAREELSRSHDLKRARAVTEAMPLLRKTSSALHTVADAASALRLRPWSKGASEAEERHCWAPSLAAESFRVRGPDFHAAGTMTPAGQAAFRPLAVQLWRVQSKVLGHVAGSKLSLLPGMARAGHRPSFTLVLLFQLPGLALCAYFERRRGGRNTDGSGGGGGGDDPVFDRVWRRFLQGDDAMKRDRLEIIPHVVEGTHLVEQTVGAAEPTILAKKLDCRFHVVEDSSHGHSGGEDGGYSYLEIDVDVTSSVVATRIFDVCRGAAGSLVLDLALKIRSVDDSETPEKILAAFRLHKIDMQELPDGSADAADLLAGAGGGRRRRSTMTPPTPPPRTDSRKRLLTSAKGVDGARKKKNE